MADSIFEQCGPGDHVAIIEYLSSSPHFETSLEIALQLLERGARVSYFYIGGALEFVDFRRNVLGLPQNFLRKIDFRSSSGRHIRPLLKKVAGLAKDIGGGGIFAFVSDLNHTPVDGQLEGRFLASCQDLTNFRYERHPFGIGLANSLTGSLGDVFPTPLRHRRLLEQILSSQIRVYHWCLDLFRRSDFSQVVFFNGRFAVSQALSVAAEECGLRLWRHEMGGLDGEGFQVIPFRTHSAVDWGRWVRARWESDAGEAAEKEKAARGLFSAAGRGRDRDGIPFIKSPESKSQGPRRQRGAGANARAVTFFTSTEGEFAFLGPDTPQSLFASQRAAAEFLVALAEETDVDLVIRAHPNAARGNRSELDWWKSFASEHASETTIVFGPESSVDSYQLLDESDLVITWGSSIAMEAIYAGVPAVSLAHDSYVHAGAEVHVPQSVAELRSLIEQPPEVKNRDSVLPWAYASCVSQEKFRWYKPISAHKGAFLGVQVR